jgi:hypothetical protein
VLGTDDSEVPPVQGSHVGQLEQLSDRDDGGVRRAAWQVGVAAHELSRTLQVDCGDGDLLGLAGGD